MAYHDNGTILDFMAGNLGIWTLFDYLGEPNSRNRANVQGLRHHLGPCLTRFSAPHRPSRAVRDALLGDPADGMLTGACNPILRPIPVVRRAAAP